MGTVEARKNLMLTVDAMAQAGIDTPLVVCGRWTPYQDQVAARAKERGISHLLHFRNAVRFDRLPAIYQMARAVTYTSLFEGFGIPILEALNSGVPVITSRGGVFPETGGDAACYVDPRSVSEMAAALRLVLEDEAQRRRMIQEGRAHALRFRQEAIFPTLWAAYQKALL